MVREISKDFKPHILHTAKIVISLAVTIHNYIQFENIHKIHRSY